MTPPAMPLRSASLRTTCCICTCTAQPGGKLSKHGTPAPQRGWGWGVGAVERNRMSDLRLSTCCCQNARPQVGWAWLGEWHRPARCQWLA